MIQASELIDDVAVQSKLLVIDDDEFHNESLEDLLEDRYHLEFSTSGASAKETINAFHPDLILLDIDLPDMTGFELCEYFKEDEAFRDIPIIFLTGKLSLEDKVKGFTAGGADYITKPFEMEEMIVRVDTHLNLRSALKTIRYYNQNLQQMLDSRTRELIKAEKHSAFSIMIKGIIHNLSSPLMGISLNLDTVKRKMLNLQDELNDSHNKDGVATLENIVQYLDLTRACSDNMEKVLNVLITKSSYGRKEQKEEFDLNEFLRNEIKFMESNIAFKHNISKSIQLSELSLPINAIPADISQIFHNLVNNAIDAVADSMNPEIEISADSDDAWVWFAIKDNGTGVNDENMQKIFDPFFSTKAQQDIISNSQSLGLGLYTCCEIVKSYDGRIEAANNPEHGATFKVFVPR